MTIAKVKPWVQPAPFKIDGSVLPEDVQHVLVNHCISIENMYDYMDGDLNSPLFLNEDFEEEFDDEPISTGINYTEIIKQHLPADYKESRIGVFFCNG